MKNTSILVFILFLIFSCGKKEVEKQDQLMEEPIIEIKKEIDNINELDKVIEESELVFTVQIAALQKTNNELINLQSVVTFKENGLTKYRLGAFKTYKEARAFRKQILNTYPDAFVQALKNDKPISITKALQ